MSRGLARGALDLAGSLALVALPLACADPDAAAHAADHRAGVEAFEQGRCGEALATLLALREGAADGSPTALLHDVALAALCAGEHEHAAAALEELSAREGRPSRARATFLAGNLAFARGEAALALSPAPDLEGALAHVEDALVAWRDAALSRSDWPAARRNVERALLVREALRRRLADAQAQAPPEPDIAEDALIPEDEDEDPLEPGEEQDEPAAPAPPVTALSAEEVELVLERLAAREAEKLELRSARRAERSAAVERDW